MSSSQIVLPEVAMQQAFMQLFRMEKDSNREIAEENCKTTKIAITVLERLVSDLKLEIATLSHRFVETQEKQSIQKELLRAEISGLKRELMTNIELLRTEFLKEKEETQKKIASLEQGRIEDRQRAAATLEGVSGAIIDFATDGMNGLIGQTKEALEACCNATFSYTDDTRKDCIEAMRGMLNSMKEAFGLVGKHLKRIAKKVTQQEVLVRVLLRVGIQQGLTGETITKLIPGVVARLKQEEEAAKAQEGTGESSS